MTYFSFNFLSTNSNETILYSQDMSDATTTSTTTTTTTTTTPSPAPQQVLSNVLAREEPVGEDTNAIVVVPVESQTEEVVTSSEQELSEITSPSMTSTSDMTTQNSSSENSRAETSASTFDRSLVAPSPAVDVNLAPSSCKSRFQGT